MGVPYPEHLRSNLRELSIVKPCCLLKKEGKGYVEMVGASDEEKNQLEKMISVRFFFSLSLFNTRRELDLRR